MIIIWSDVKSSVYGNTAESVLNWCARAPLDIFPRARSEARVGVVRHVSANVLVQRSDETRVGITRHVNANVGVGQQ